VGPKDKTDLQSVVVSRVMVEHLRLATRCFDTKVSVTPAQVSRAFRHEGEALRVFTACLSVLYMAIKWHERQTSSLWRSVLRGGHPARRHLAGCVRIPPLSYLSRRTTEDAWGRVRPFIAKHGVNYPIAMGDDAISRAYSLNAFPATYLIDKSGRIAVAYVGVVINKDNVATNVRSLLAER
jgi:hypothetical protein